LAGKWRSINKTFKITEILRSARCVKTTNHWEKEIKKARKAKAVRRWKKRRGKNKKIKGGD
jgi:hypothetical protein